MAARSYKKSHCAYSKRHRPRPSLLREIKLEVQLWQGGKTPDATEFSSFSSRAVEAAHVVRAVEVAQDGEERRGDEGGAQVAGLARQPRERCPQAEAEQPLAVEAEVLRAIAQRRYRNGQGVLRRKSLQKECEVSHHTHGTHAVRQCAARQQLWPASHRVTL